MASVVQAVRNTQNCAVTFLALELVCIFRGYFLEDLKRVPGGTRGRRGLGVQKGCLDLVRLERVDDRDRESSFTAADSASSDRVCVNAGCVSSVIAMSFPRYYSGNAGGKFRKRSDF